ncbi:MAG TPA: ATP-binding cassette domain-containing protein [Candidatus Omnitrophota bacterium]|nr:ATP-binding cassette domain-containing protein [Candidatus Omnitrophota bacterium]
MDTIIEVKDLTLTYGEYSVLSRLNFSVKKNEIFVIMGGSGCGKSTLLKSLIGLLWPKRGRVLYTGESFWEAPEERRQELMRCFGVLYQSGALWSSLTLAENVALPLQLYSNLTADQIADLANYKLGLVGLAGYSDFYPVELSGGMRKRAGLARAIALDPDIIFFDEPSAGLDPVNAKMLDDLILELRDTLGATIIVITHELPSIFAIADNSILLDTQNKGIIAYGSPKRLLLESKDQRVIDFLTRGEKQGVFK